MKKWIHCCDICGRQLKDGSFFDGYRIKAKSEWFAKDKLVINIFTTRRTLEVCRFCAQEFVNWVHEKRREAEENE